MTDTGDSRSQIIVSCPVCRKTYRPSRRAVADGSWINCPNCTPNSGAERVETAREA
jgi:ssDNA-binding Zn-finger/Zn-ribbon topoisomerase 1